jgi:RHS repeat-associated protein
VVWTATLLDAYGTVAIDDRVGLQYAGRWPGHWWDDDLGLQYNRFRWYDVRAGRYVASDPLGTAGGVNLYAYAANPTARVDLLGLTDTKCKSSASPQPHGVGAEPAAERVARPEDPSQVRPSEIVARNTRRYTLVADENIGANLSREEAAEVMHQRTRAIVEALAIEARMRAENRRAALLDVEAAHRNLREASREVSATGKRVGQLRSANPNAAEREAAMEAHTQARQRREAAANQLERSQAASQCADSEMISGQPGAVYEPVYVPESGRMVIAHSGAEGASDAIERLPREQSLTPSTAPGHCGLPRAAGAIADDIPHGSSRPRIQTIQGGYSFRNDGTVEHVHRCANCGDIVARPRNRIETVGGLPPGVPSNVAAGERTTLPHRDER